MLKFVQKHKKDVPLLFTLKIHTFMKANLSSQIKLDRTPKRYYRPANAFERTALTRFEKIQTEIYESTEEGSSQIAKEVSDLIRNRKKEGRFCVMALGSGPGTHSVYKELVRLHRDEKLSFSNVIVFNISEFYPLDETAPGTTRILQETLLNQVDIDPTNVFTPRGTTEKEGVFEFCKEYEKSIENYGGLDLALLEIGPLGNLGFNEPGSQANSSTRLMLIGSESRHNASGMFSSTESVPGIAITMGISTILGAKKLILMAWGENKAAIIKGAIEGNVTDALPASYLQLHKDAKVVLDLSAAENLTRISTPWLVTSCEWNDKLIRRAIVWLCKITGKPILKLTNKDYNDNGLSELLALYGSAYNVNIKIFNDLQHTITGWPGGKPNADDTFRPERAKPYPKKVIVFSPHPDDDVISMGGTLKRLVDQHHDVHVAYETSGNIAVGDEDMMRYVMLMQSIAKEFQFETPEAMAKLEEITEFVKQKKDGDIDLKLIRYLKGQIRQGEARTACNYIGVKPENVHFLQLPFYETGTIKKGELSEADRDIVKNLLLEVKPDQIFVAGDLADPHGTHRVCLDAVLAAIDDVKNDKWMKNCRVWMYRGAWAEWEIDHIEMAVPISPEELRQKRNSILKHQSQMENAPFLGDDERLFWQRSEDRNRATANLYTQLGLASYEAIEAFVEYHPQ